MFRKPTVKVADDHFKLYLLIKLEKTMSGPQCCSNPPTLDRSAGAGHVVQLGGLSSYVSGSPDSNLAVLLISDIFGTLQLKLIPLN
jgi:hypothetical protein